jgi:choline dehydrogenase-like flavoprotein
VPHADIPLLTRAAQHRLDSLDPVIRRQVEIALRLLTSRAGGVLAGHAPRTFAALTDAARDRRLEAWERSRLPRLRSAFQALRRLILAAWYTLPESWPDTGYLGPLTTRQPTFPWEGPASGSARADEPVLRAAAMPRAAAGTRRSAAATPPTSPFIDTDVCIIGSGAGGAVAAARLAGAGLDVLVLEQGGLHEAADYDGDELRMTARLYADGGARATTDGAIPLLQAECVGGGTIVNWMIMLRPRPWVLDEWSRHYGGGVLSAAELLPALQRIEAEVGARTVPDDAHSPANRALLDGCRGLGWSAHPASINAHDCVRAGLCGLGCPWGAKRDALHVHLPSATAAGARILHSAQARRITGRTGDFRVEVRTRPDSRSVTVRARTVVLAGGAVGSPLLLLRSDLGGPAVGRFLRLHPTTAVVGAYAAPMYAAAGIPLSAYCDEFLHGRSGYGAWIECPPLQPALAAIALPGFGMAHHSWMSRFASIANFIVLARDGAARDVSSGDVRARRDGGARIRYALHPLDAATLTTGIQAAADIHFAAGATEVRTLHSRGSTLTSATGIRAIRDWPVAANTLGLFSAHVNGTCRMGTDRRTSVCSPDGECHAAAGIFVADGSLLPTAPGVNPQATIMALADRVAARIAAAR